MKFVIKYLVGISVLLLSTFVTWYEGSYIRYNSYEWKYTAFFSKTFNGEIIHKSDISQLDYFIYAVKFYPFFQFKRYAVYQSFNNKHLLSMEKEYNNTNHFT
ncbi:DUF4306 domain-containing protein [Oceanobacillus piezotolerans]|uniref:DUF4306 domain-containing protein n=1 Tax=Oceanobacillus piezotolerans TaxID=2448030 RepID=A0A498DU24_9BACI|nr:DUF4306 domain-containing protein [Oceanobacillus piezotolerans]RLL48357.1 DUF4306 domain-containing protein [Oceanobacillus piezotolerans]